MSTQIQVARWPRWLAAAILAAALTLAAVALVAQIGAVRSVPGTADTTGGASVDEILDTLSRPGPNRGQVRFGPLDRDLELIRPHGVHQPPKRDANG